MFGTFRVLGVKTDIAFQNLNPFLLTTEGELVVKSFVRISGHLVADSLSTAASGSARVRAITKSDMRDLTSR